MLPFNRKSDMSFFLAINNIGGSRGIQIGSLTFTTSNFFYHVTDFHLSFYHGRIEICVKITKLPVKAHLSVSIEYLNIYRDAHNRRKQMVRSKPTCPFAKVTRL